MSKIIAEFELGYYGASLEPKWRSEWRVAELYEMSGKYIMGNGIVTREGMKAVQNYHPDTIRYKIIDRGDIDFYYHNGKCVRCNCTRANNKFKTYSNLF